MQESSDEEDELKSSASESESDSDSELGTKKKKTTRRKLTASTVLNTSSQLLEQVDENTLNTQNSLYGKKKNCLSYKHIN